MKHMGERRGGDDAGKRREGPDVADAAHHERHVEAAQDEAREIDAAEQADLERREGLDLRAHGQERVDQPVAGEEDRRAEQQRGKLPKCRGHGDVHVGWRCRRVNALSPGSGEIDEAGRQGNNFRGRLPTVGPQVPWDARDDSCPVRDSPGL